MAVIPVIKPKTLEELKAEKIQQVKRQAYNLLKETDWYIVRQQETGKEIPQDVLDERQSIRNQSEVIEQEISELETKEELRNYQIELGD